MPASLGFDVLHFVYVLCAALVVGGGVALGGAAAPALFRALERAEAGTVFGQILARWDGVAIAAAVVLAVATLWRALAFEAGEALVARWIGVAAVLLGTLYSSAWANPIARGLRAQTPGFDELPANAPERREFARYHARSTRAMSFAVLGGILALYLS